MADEGRDPLTERELRRAELVGLGLLAVRALRRPPRLIVVCFIWLVVGIYVHGV